MKTEKMGISYSHQWTRYTILRVMLAACSLVGMVLASGAPGHWS